jgi:hypothetical protein
MIAAIRSPGSLCKAAEAVRRRSARLRHQDHQVGDDHARFQIGGLLARTEIHNDTIIFRAQNLEAGDDRKRRIQLRNRRCRAQYKYIQCLRFQMEGRKPPRELSARA